MDGIALGAETIFYIFGFPVTNAFFVQVVLSIALMVFLIIATKKLKPRPSKRQMAFETIFNIILKNVDNVTGHREKTKKILPFVATLFFYILVCNFFAMVPGLSALSIRYGDGSVDLFRTATSDYSKVFVMAFAVMLMSQFLFIFYNRLSGFRKQFLDFSSPVNVVLGLMNVIGEFSKVLSLSLRLFGNMFAGEVLAAVMIFLVPFIAPLPFSFLGILTAAIQAFVFSVLSTVYLSQALQTPEADKKFAKIEKKRHVESLGDFGDLKIEVLN
ncbi:MAG: F0F1 ATP synthase subunit A [Pseudomonadales bacterium]|jgi:F-type H+-transporting ATPase subunit a|nr:F0F1 ATP synthase subunit A [Pseudomonadales bacterium]